MLFDTLPHPSCGSTKRLAFTFTATDVVLLRLLRDCMTVSMGRTSSVGVIRYGLHLVAAHLGMTDLPPSIPDAVLATSSPAGPPPT
jgi:hypothetical protein